MKDNMTRRQFLATTSAAVVYLGLRALTVSADTSNVSSSTPYKPTLDPSKGEENMPNKVLVVYATRSGSTREIAERMATVLRQMGIQADVVNAKKCKSVAGYDAVIVGSAIRMGKVMSEATKVVDRNMEALALVPTAFFSVSLGAKETDEETVTQVAGYLDGLRALVEPKASADFAGVLDMATIGPVFRFFFKMAGDDMGNMTEGDFRDWEAIESWVSGLYR